MFFVPGLGIIISIITFPGIIVHELAHQLFCRLYKVPVFEVVYFRTQNPMGYVLHEKPATNLQATMISTGPFFLNTILGFVIAFPAAVQYKLGAAYPIDYLLLYLGVSIAMHAFPSTGDAKSLWEHISDKETPLLTKIIVTPIIGLMYAGALGSMVWLDAIYGFAVAVGLPFLVIRLFA